MHPWLGDTAIIKVALDTFGLLLKPVVDVLLRFTARTRPMSFIDWDEVEEEGEAFSVDPFPAEPMNKLHPNTVALLSAKNEFRSDNN